MINHEENVKYLWRMYLANIAGIYSIWLELKHNSFFSLSVCNDIYIGKTASNKREKNIQSLLRVGLNYDDMLKKSRLKCLEIDEYKYFYSVRMIAITLRKAESWYCILIMKKLGQSVKCAFITRQANLSVHSGALKNQTWHRSWHK